MSFNRNVRFLNDRLNDHFIHLMLASGRSFHLDENGIVYFAEHGEEAIEDLLIKLCNSHFDSWQVLSCPADWVNKYRYKMRELKVPYLEEINDGRIEFLLPQSYNPHEWDFSAA